MTAQATRPSATGQPLGARGWSLGSRLGALKVHMLAWGETCADYYQAAALYEQLSGLCDAELHRRGLSRDTLPWDLSRACDRTNE